LLEAESEALWAGLRGRLNVKAWMGAEVRRKSVVVEAAPFRVWQLLAVPAAITCGLRVAKVPGAKTGGGLYALCLLVGASLVAVLVWRATPRDRYWLVVAAGIGVAAIWDYTLQIHDDARRALLDAHGSWRVVGVVAVCAAIASGGIILLWFLGRQPRRAARHFGVAIVLVAVAAVGLDAMSPTVFERTDPQRLWYRAFVSGEEFVEMLGFALLLIALLEVLASKLPSPGRFDSEFRL
jgi:hypothetical protein